MKIGTDATRIPASDEVISCCPAAINRNGATTWTVATSARIAQEAPAPASAPRRQAIGISTAAPSATRRKTIIAGESSRSPIVMNM